MENNVDKVFKYIQEKIINKEWAVGDKITSEVPLSKELGVSRSVVREAIKSFVALDILSRVQGGGTYVNSITSNVYFNDILPNLSTELNGFNEILEVRKALDPLAIKMAMKHSHTHLLSDLSLLMNKMRECKHLSQSFYEYTIEFHHKFAEHSGNDLLAKLYEIMRHITKIYAKQSISTIKYSKNTLLEQHEKIFDKVKLKDSENAGILSLLYIKNVLSKINDFES